VTVRRLLLTCLLWLVSGLSLAGTTITYEGTFANFAADTAVGQSQGIFGPPRSLAGLPFTPVVRITDHVGFPLRPGDVTVTLTVDGAAVTMGVVASNRFCADERCGLFAHLQGTSGTGDDDWFEVALPSFSPSCLTDNITAAQDAFNFFLVQRSTTVSRAGAYGAMIITSVSVQPSATGGAQ